MKVFKAIVVTTIDIILIVPRIIIWKLADWLDMLADWESRWLK